MELSAGQIGIVETVYFGRVVLRILKHGSGHVSLDVNQAGLYDQTTTTGELCQRQQIVFVCLVDITVQQLANVQPIDLPTAAEIMQSALDALPQAVIADRALLLFYVQGLSLPKRQALDAAMKSGLMPVRCCCVDRDLANR